MCDTLVGSHCTMTHYGVFSQPNVTLNSFSKRFFLLREQTPNFLLAVWRHGKENLANKSETFCWREIREKSTYGNTVVPTYWISLRPESSGIRWSFSATDYTHCSFNLSFLVISSAKVWNEDTMDAVETTENSVSLILTTEWYDNLLLDGRRK